MKNTIPLTQYAFDVLSKKQSELSAILSSKSNRTVELQRKQNLARKELHELDQVLGAGFVRNFNPDQPAMVQIGAVVVLENMATSDKREYRIMTRSTADPLKGVISNESPLAQKMLGLSLKNTFKYRDNYGKEDSYKIVSID